MKNILLLIFFFIYSSYADSLPDYLKDSHNNKIKDFKTKDFELKFKKYDLWINKNGETDARGSDLLNFQSLKVYFISNNKKSLLFQQDEFRPYGQDVVTVVCKQTKSKSILFVQTNFSSVHNVYGWFIDFEPYIFEINDKLDILRNEEIEDKYFFGNDYFKRISPDIPKPEDESYPYYNQEKILNRLYETNTCDKEETEKANIEVLVNGKWVLQEESWNITKDEYIIKLEKQPLYKQPNKNSKTKMYLIKNNKVEILEEKEDWIYILYITKDNKEIKAWIPKNEL